MKNKTTKRKLIDDVLFQEIINDTLINIWGKKYQLTDLEEDLLMLRLNRTFGMIRMINEQKEIENLKKMGNLTLPQITKKTPLYTG